MGSSTNLTPIVLDQCETGLSGTTSSDSCTGSAEDNNNIFVCDTSAPLCITQSANTGIYRVESRPGGRSLLPQRSGTGPYTVTISPAIRNPELVIQPKGPAHGGEPDDTMAGVEEPDGDESTTGQRSVTDDDLQ